MRRALLWTILALVAAWPSPVRAEDSDAIDAQVQAVLRRRAELDALYVQAREQHARMRALVAGSAADAQRLASWLEAPERRRILEQIVARRRANVAAENGDGELEEAAAVAGPGDAWLAWSPAILGELDDRARKDAGATGQALLTDVLRDISRRDVAEAWDSYMTRHPVVVAWRAARTRLADLRRIAAARAPTPLIAVPKGRFDVGPWEGWIEDIPEKLNRRQKVSVAALHVEKYEVTWAQYVDFVVAQPEGRRAALLPALALDSDDDEPLAPYGREDHPVTGVSFLQAQAYAAWRGMRLPTEDEWERIATGGDVARVFPWGATTDGRRFAHRGAGEPGTRPVFASPDDATPEGVLDLAGNVKELVATHPDRKPVKRVPEVDERVIVRGGGFRTRADECSTTWRWFVEAGAQEPDVGFRCVIDDAVLRRRRER